MLYLLYDIGCTEDQHNFWRQIQNPQFKQRGLTIISFVGGGRSVSGGQLWSLRRWNSRVFFGPALAALSNILVCRSIVEKELGTVSFWQFRCWSVGGSHRKKSARQSWKWQSTWIATESNLFIPRFRSSNDLQRGVNLFELFAKHQPGMAGCGWLQPGRNFLST